MAALRSLVLAPFCFAGCGEPAPLDRPTPREVSMARLPELTSVALPDTGMTTCQLASGWSGRLQVLVGEGSRILHDVELTEGQFTVTAARGRPGSALLVRPGAVAIPYRWSDLDDQKIATCEPEVLVPPSAVLVTGSVEGDCAEGQQARVLGCEGTAVADADGGFELWVRDGLTSCSLEAHCEPAACPGVRFLDETPWGPAVEVAPPMRAVGLRLPAAQRVGGRLAAELEWTASGPVVVSVHAGVGQLQVGDLLLSVRGESTRAIQLTDTVRGRVGERVPLTIQRGDEILRLQAVLVGD